MARMLLLARVSSCWCSLRGYLVLTLQNLLTVQPLYCGGVAVVNGVSSGVGGRPGASSEVNLKARRHKSWCVASRCSAELMNTGAVQVSASVLKSVSSSLLTWSLAASQVKLFR